MNVEATKVVARDCAGDVLHARRTQEGAGLQRLVRCILPSTWARSVSPLMATTLPALEALGPLDMESAPRRVSVVGTRAASAEGCAAAREVARVLSHAGVVVVSGMARGIDRAAHEAALDAGGQTMGVLGVPIATALAKADPLMTRMAAEALLLSAYREGAAPTPGNFLERNRLMAAMVDAVVVVEAPERSGALHHVRALQSLQKPVFVHPIACQRRRLRWPARFLAQGAQLWGVPPG